MYIQLTAVVPRGIVTRWRDARGAFSLRARRWQSFSSYTAPASTIARNLADALYCDLGHGHQSDRIFGADRRYRRRTGMDPPRPPQSEFESARMAHCILRDGQCPLVRNCSRHDLGLADEHRA